MNSEYTYSIEGGAGKSRSKNPKKEGKMETWEALKKLKDLEIEKIEKGRGKVEKKLNKLDLIEKVLKCGEEAFGESGRSFVRNDDTEVIFTTMNLRILDDYDGTGVLEFIGDNFESLYIYNMRSKDVTLLKRGTCFMGEKIIDLVECSKYKNDIIVSYYRNDVRELSVFLKANI